MIIRSEDDCANHHTTDTIFKKFTLHVQGPPTQIDTFQTNIFSWLDDIMIKKKIFLKSSDREIWYKSFNLGIHIFLWLQSLHIWKIQRVVFLIFVDIFKWKWKQKQCSLLPISDRTNVSTEKIYTSYESLNTQLLWARETRAWHTHGGPTPTSLQKIYIFSFWGHGGHVRLKKWKNNVLYQISLSQDPKNHVLLNKVSQNHEKNGHLKCINMSWRTLYKRITKRQILYIFLIFLKVSTHK